MAGEGGAMSGAVRSDDRASMAHNS